MDEESESSKKKKCLKSNEVLNVSCDWPLVMPNVKKKEELEKKK